MEKRWVAAVLVLIVIELVVRLPLGGGYSRSLLRVFHRKSGFITFPVLDDEWIVGARPLSFRIVDGVAMDAHAVYVGGVRHLGIDRAQLRKLSGDYWRTDRAIRHGTLLLVPQPGRDGRAWTFDIESFEALTPFLARDRNGLYVRHPLAQATETTADGRGYPALPYRPLELVDRATFALTGRGNEGRDRRYRYRFAWGTDGGVVAGDWDAVFDVVASVDGSPVEPRGAGYARLIDGTYWRGWRMDVAGAIRPYCAEPPEKCGYRLYARDDRSLYYRHFRIPDGDPDTFRELPGGGGCGEDRHGHLCQGQRRSH